ncbi:DUF1566 domain-containing protein, partial [Desulfobacterota bacterium AH_259_B03_O07]|nr:DUF1566 domain-containing protein [Desulfobacterota bacterium AH_259_B03_O07]
GDYRGAIQDFNKAIEINPDAFGVSGHGKALVYTNNGDGTFTDNFTTWMWEIKTNVGGSVHNVNNTFSWTTGTTLPTGTLFTVFLDTLNNKCDGDETTACTTDADCTGIGNELCGLAGHRTWCIPNVKVLVSIQDHSKAAAPKSSVPGLTFPLDYWSATTNASGTLGAFFVSYSNLVVFVADKNLSNHARAVLCK